MGGLEFHSAGRRIDGRNQDEDGDEQRDKSRYDPYFVAVMHHQPPCIIRSCRAPMSKFGHLEVGSDLSCLRQSAPTTGGQDKLFRPVGSDGRVGSGTVIGIDLGGGIQWPTIHVRQHRRRCPLKRAASQWFASRLGPELMPEPSPELAVGLAFLKQGEEVAGRDALEHFGDAAEADLGKAVRDVAGIQAVQEELEHFVASVTRQLFFSAPPPDSLQISVCV